MTTQSIDSVEYQNQIDHVNSIANDAVDLLTKLIQVKHVNPFCQKYRCRFWSGMGGYNFITRHGKDLLAYSFDRSPHALRVMVVRRFENTQAGKEVLEIAKILELKGHPSDNCSIGAYMSDFSPDPTIRR